jgi:hypothetical protein
MIQAIVPGEPTMEYAAEDLSEQRDACTYHWPLGCQFTGQQIAHSLQASGGYIDQNAAGNNYGTVVSCGVRVAG